jgi:Beta-glucosidase-related glycosidases
MAQQSIVLLKNDNLLPLDKTKLKKVAVVGPNANNPEMQLGNYNGFPTRIITPYEGLKEYLEGQAEVYCYSVIDYYGPTPKSFANEISKFKDVDLIIFVGGLSPRIEGEQLQLDALGFYGGDRTSILLPKLQTDFMKALKTTGKPVVFVMMTGSAIAIPWESENIPAVLNAWYGGEAIGKALVDVLFGDYNPSGKLPVTFYQGDKDLPDFEDYDMSNRTYKYFKGRPLYPFGYGLSYTGFKYNWLVKPHATYNDVDNIKCAITISNTGNMPGDEVAQLYVCYPEGKGYPVKELRGFERKYILHGKAEEVSFEIPIVSFAKWMKEEGKMDVPKGKYRLFVGGNSEDMRVVAEFEVE